MNASSAFRVQRSVAHQFAKASPAGLAWLHSGGKWKPFDHLQIISDALIEVSEGKNDRLMILAPPQHGKSEITSRTFPAWHIGHNPSDKVACCSYAESLSKESGRANRDIMQAWGPALFGQTIRRDHAAAASWQLSGQRGSLLCVGRGSGITGKPADMLVIDDPIKDYEEAMSPTIRESVWNWYTTVLLTRLSENGRVILIQTQWHKDDLAGRIQNKIETGEEPPWKIVKLPAINEEGQALCPQLHSLSSLRQKEKTLGQYKWSCLFQQEPIDAGDTEWGEDLLSDIWAEPNKFPPRLKFCCAVLDPASGKKTADHDFPAFVINGTQTFDQFYFDAIMEKLTFAELRPVVIEYLSRESTPEPSVLSIEVDSKQYGEHPTDFSNFEGAKLFQREIRNAGLRTVVMLHTSSKNKHARIRLWLGENIHNRRFKAIRNKYTEEVVKQLGYFPKSKKGFHDDGPDALAETMRIVKQFIKKLKEANG